MYVLRLLKLTNIIEKLFLTLSGGAIQRDLGIAPANTTLLPWSRDYYELEWLLRLHTVLTAPGYGQTEASGAAQRWSELVVSVLGVGLGSKWCRFRDSNTDFT